MRTRSQRLLSMVLALSMLLTFLPVSAFADDGSTSAAENIYTYNVSGQGTYTYTLNADDTATLTKFTGTNADVPEKVTKDGNPYTVTAIGAEAFATKRTVTTGQYTQTVYDKITQLTSVKLPNTITVIGDHAFANCVNIQSIEIPDSVTEIKESAFESCSSLGSVDLSENLTTIGDHAFASCEKIQTIKIPDSVTEIETGTFGHCSLLKSVKLPINLTTIGMGAFANCPDLESIELPDGLMNVEENAFSGANLGTIDWPVTLTNVGTSAFQNQIDYSSFPPSINVSIKTITYHGTQAQWDKMKNDRDFATTNFQLVAEGVDLRCAHTVTFDKNGHGDPKDQVVQYEGYVDTSNVDAPTADGYKFMGWYTASEGGEKFVFENSPITKDKTLYAHWEEDKKTEPEKPDQPTPPQNPDDNKPGTPEKPNEPTPPEAPAVEEDDTAAIGYAAAAVTAAFVGWGAYRIGSEVYLKYLLPNDVLLPQNRIQLAELLWEDAGRPAPAAAAAYTDVDANDADARQAARWAVENGLLTLPDTEKPEEFVPYRSVSYAKSARAWNKAQQLKENAAAR